MKRFSFPGSTLWILLFLGGVISRSSLATDNGTSRGWECPVYGIDFEKHDIQHEDVSSWEDCGYMCQLNTDCKFWTWTTKHHEVKRSPSDKHPVLKKKNFLQTCY
jgi:hypothetical protein